MVTEQQIQSDLAIPPGEYLEEVLDALGMTKNELARRMNRPAAKLSAIYKGEKAITPDTALRLERVVGVPAHIWSGLESDYRLTLARMNKDKEQEQLRKETKLVTKYRYADLANQGVLEKVTRPVEKVLALQKFFGVTSLHTVPDLCRYQPAFNPKFRIGNHKNKIDHSGAIAAWLRMGELAAADIHCEAFNAKTLKKTVGRIRKMTRQSPEQFQDALHRILADSGVALTICPHLKGTGIHGATFWMGPGKAVLMMTLRYKWADIFWFSLFHELGHIRLHGRNAVILEGANGDPQLKKQEIQADQYAADILIPPEDYKLFIKNNRFYPDDIQLFADRIGIDPGIVVGRLQNDGFLKPSWHNRLRMRFEWKSDT